MSSSARIRHPLIKYLWRHTPKGDDHLFSAIHEHCERGGEARIQRCGTASYSIVLNNTLWLSRTIGGSPVGSFHCIAAAVIAGDRYMDACSNDDDNSQGTA